MRIRKILLIHPSRSIRALLKKYIFAELADIEFIEADSGCNALEQIGATGFDVILSTDRLKDLGLKELKIRQEASDANGYTPLIIISESESNHVRNELVRQGFDCVVQIRVRPSDLIHKINAACDPRDWRKYARYHIPGAAVIFKLQQKKIEAQLINISMGGVLVELTTKDPGGLIQGGIATELRIPLSPDNPAAITGLTAKVLRLEVVNWNAGFAPRTMRATFVFVDLAAGAKGKLAELIQMAKEDKLEASEIKD